MKKVLIVANDYSTIYNFRLELLRRLIKEEYTVIIALPPDRRNTMFERLGCRVEPLKLSRFGTNPIADFRTMAEIVKIVKRVRPIAMLTYTAKPNIYGGIAARLTKTPYVCNVTGLGANFQSKNLIAAIMLILQRIAYRRARVVVFQNQSNFDFFKKKRVVRDQAALLPGSGVNIEENKYELYPNNLIPRFITVARIRQDKGYDELFEVIRRLSAKAEFHIVGWYEDEAYRSAVEEMQHQYGVTFYENMQHENVHDLIKECDCLIHPSYHEGMSNVILEAAAAGRPCIVSDIPGCREGVENGKTGYCFSVKNADALWECVTRFLQLSQGERAQMGALARKKMEEEFDRNIVINAYMEEINKIAGENNG